MNTILKYAVAAAMTGALALAAASPSQARDGRNAAAIGGFAAGAVVGAAVAGSAYNNGYDYGPAYYGPGYGYEPAYAYEPRTVYVQPGPRYRDGNYYRGSAPVNLP